MNRGATILTAFAVAFVLAGSAIAGKPTSSGSTGGKATASLELVVVAAGDALRSSASQPVHGGIVTFDVKAEGVTKPWVQVRCNQAGTVVYESWHGFFEGYFTDPLFTLDSDPWSAGPATCTARLVAFDRNGRDATLATTSFEVAA